jgi:hypothetical protein
MPFIASSNSVMTSYLSFTHRKYISNWAVSLVSVLPSTVSTVSFNCLSNHCSCLPHDVQLFFWINVSFRKLFYFLGKLLQLHPRNTVSEILSENCLLCSNRSFLQLVLCYETVCLIQHNCFSLFLHPKITDTKCVILLSKVLFEDWRPLTRWPRHSTIDATSLKKRFSSHSSLNTLHSLYIFHCLLAHIMQD